MRGQGECAREKHDMCALYIKRERERERERARKRGRKGRTRKRAGRVYTDCDRQIDREREAGTATEGVFSNVQRRDLDGGKVAFESDNLADKLIVTDTNKLVHGSPAHVLGRDDWPR